MIAQVKRDDIVITIDSNIFCLDGELTLSMVVNMINVRNARYINIYSRDVANSNGYAVMDNYDKAWSAFVNACRFFGLDYTDTWGTNRNSIYHCRGYEWLHCITKRASA